MGLICTFITEEGIFAHWLEDNSVSIKLTPGAEYITVASVLIMKIIFELLIQNNIP